MSDLLTGRPKSGHRELHADLRTLLLSQKTELISELTRATANQFNNIMMAITTNCWVSRSTTFKTPGGSGTKIARRICKGQANHEIQHKLRRSCASAESAPRE